MKNLTVVSPVFQEAEVIADFYHTLKNELNQLSEYTSTILFVVDRGQDATLDILKDIAARDPKVRILGLSARFGHQMSLLAGIDQAEPGLVIMMDSDLQHPPSLIPKLLAEFEKGSEIVNAIREDTENITWFKKITSRLFYSTLNRISTVKLAENAPDFRLISERVVRLIKENIRERNLFLRGIIGWIGFKQTNLHFIALARSRGESKYSIARLLGLGLSGLISFSRKPLRAAFGVGGLGIGLTVISVLVMIVRFLTSQTSPSVLVGLGTVIIFVSSLQFIFLGIIGEYVGAVFEETKGRPHYIIEEKINFYEKN